MKKIDTDILVLKRAAKALSCSTSQKMLNANIEFLIDHFLRHPSKKLLRIFKDREDRAYIAGSQDAKAHIARQQYHDA